MIKKQITYTDYDGNETEEFMQTEAYSEMFTELVTDAGATSEFIQGIIPQKLAAQVMAEQKKLEAVK
ncbi:MAG: hypothetical protein ACLVJ6_12145 [Merdibacter sp.]